MSIVAPILTLGALGALFGVLLAIASKVFATGRDPKSQEVQNALPGANCGGCGFPGCAQLAEAILAGTAPVSACPVGGPQAARRIAAIMGVDAPRTVPYAARVACRGNDSAEQKYRYAGISHCASANLVAGGPLSCTYGCLGLGSCTVVCDYGAIRIEKGVAVVDARRCRACGKCVSACPRSLIALMPYEYKAVVPCASLLAGKEQKKLCGAGCLGCGLCVKACPNRAIGVEGNLARIDSDTCTGCGACVKACPQGLIIMAGAHAKIPAKGRRQKAD